jgi:RimJ/RimL family protein N-acetyltransferase
LTNHLLIRINQIPGNDKIVHLREPELADRDVIRMFRSDKVLQDMLMAYPPEMYVDDVDAWLKKKQDQPDSFFRIVAKCGDNSCLGFVQITNAHRRSRNGYIGIAVKPKGQGYGGAALRELISVAVNEYNFHKLLLEVREDNVRAINFYLAHGFRNVGVLREHYLQKDLWINAIIMERML